MCRTGARRWNIWSTVSCSSRWCFRFWPGGLFTQFAKEIGLVLYQSEEIGFYLSILGPLMPFMYMESMVDGILKGLGEQLSSFVIRRWIRLCASR